MKKVLLSFLIMAYTCTAFAQMSAQEKRRMENRVEGSFPSLDKREEPGINNINFGLVAGMLNPHGSIGSSAEYGVNIGFMPVRHLGAGLELTTTELDKVNVQMTNLLARGTYHLAGDIPILKDSFLGVTGGPIFIEDGDTEWAIGPIVGFDIPLQNQSSGYLTLGLQARYLLISDADDTFSAAAALKYWY